MSATTQSCLYTRHTIPFLRFSRRQYSLQAKDLPKTGISFPNPKGFPSVQYPVVNESLRHPDSPLGLFNVPRSSNGTSTALTQFVRKTKLSGPYPIINWQHWVSNSSARSVSSENDTINVISKIPTLTKYSIASKMLFVPKYLYDVLRHFARVWSLRKEINERVNLPNGGFNAIVSSIISSELYYSRINRLSASEDDMRKSPGSSVHEPSELIDVYIPDPEELSRTEFQILRRSTSPLYLPILTSLFGLNSIISKFFFPRLAVSLDLFEDTEKKYIKTWEKNILSARNTFSTSHRDAKTSNDKPDGITIDLLRKAIPLCSQEELVQIGKAIGMIPGWVHPFFIIRAPLIEALLRHMSFLIADNMLIGRWGGVWAMNESELNWALLQRAW